MNVSKAAAAVAVAGFVLFIVDGMRERLDPQAAASRSALLATAQAAVGGSCPAARTDDLAGNWKISSVACLGDCKQAHLGAGDKLRFEKDVSGEDNFGLEVRGATSKGSASRTIGYAMRSDGVGNVTGPIVLSHSVLDGTPLQTHWLIVKIRRFDVDGLGACKLRARIAVCDSEPANGAGSCSTQQHGGELHAEPDV